MHFNWLLYNLQAARFVCHIHTSEAHGIMQLDSWIHAQKYDYTQQQQQQQQHNIYEICHASHFCVMQLKCSPVAAKILEYYLQENPLNAYIEFDVEGENTWKFCQLLDSIKLCLATISVC